MNKYTLKDFEKFEKRAGRIICPSGDYTAIRNFPEVCSFEEWCSFGEVCSFGKECVVEKDKPLKKIFSIEGIGSANRKTYFFLLTNRETYMRCGCFAGYLKEFAARVSKAHAGTLYKKQYLTAIELAELSFREEAKNARSSKII